MRGIRVVIAATPRRSGLPTRMREQDRQEDQPRGDQGVVEHRHLDQQPARLRGMARGELERRVGAERGAADHRPVELEVVDQGGELVAEGGHVVGAHVGRLVGGAVAEQVDA